MRNPQFARYAAAAALLLSALPGLTHNYIISGARVEIGDGRVIENGVIVIQDGKITQVTTTPPGTVGQWERIDAAGMTAYPGFIDGFSSRNLKLPDARSQTARDQRTEVLPNMWNENRKGVEPHIRAAEHLDMSSARSLHQQGVLAAFLSPGRGSVGGIGAVCLLKEEAGENGDSAVLAPDLAIEFSFGGGQGAGYPGSLMGRIAHMRQMLYDAKHYMEYPPEDGEEDEANVALIALQSALRGEMPVVFVADSDVEILRALNIADEFGLRFVIAGAREAYKMANELKARGIPLLVSAAIGTTPNLNPSRDEAQQLDDPPQEVRQERYDNWLERAQNARRLYEAGIPFAFSSQGEPTRSFLPNVRRIIEFGLPRDAALRALTVDAARILGVADRLGTIENGKVANIVLMSGPFEKEDSKVQMVFVDGEKIEIEGDGN